jgi:hypothetical protein
MAARRRFEGGRGAHEVRLKRGAERLLVVPTKLPAAQELRVRRLALAACGSGQFTGGEKTWPFVGLERRVKVGTASESGETVRQPGGCNRWDVGGGEHMPRAMGLVVSDRARECTADMCLDYPGN